MTAPFPEKIGSRYKSFRVIDVVPLQELQCVLRLYEEESSGAKIMHIENDDPENSFCLSFQTLPSSSNGVAHILEHTTLCGSKKYPVRDPFFAMNRRSLNTFMNAFTGADFTCYPAATQVEKDFYNLLSVYLDAVFHPHLSHMSFLQEGHRLEFNERDNPNSALTYKGVVYNEMKGALASASARMAEEISLQLYPDLPYSFNSGGDPKEIPNLTHEELIKFHKRYYHPSRCLFYFYGNLPIQKHLDFLLDHTLKECEKVDPLPAIPRQPKLKEPVRKVCPYPIAEEEDPEGKSMVSFNWLTCSILNQEETLALHILLVMLMDTDASPLKRAFLNSGLCKQVGAVIDTEISEIPITFMLKGCDKDAAAPLETLLFSSLREIAANPFPEALVEAAIHQLEFQRTEISGDQFPYGLSLFMRAGLLIQHGGAPEEALKIHSLFDRLQKHLKTHPNYFNQLINRYFIENTHFVSITMVPDKTLAKQEVDEETKTLYEKQLKLTEKEKQHIIKEAEALHHYQEHADEEDPDCLPKVSMKDIPEKSRVYPLVEDRINDFKVYHHNAFTNDIVYLDVSFDLPKLALEDFFWSRLFVVVHTQMGCGGRTYAENLDRIQAYTGGVHSVLHVHQKAQDSKLCQPALQMSGRALKRNTPVLFGMVRDFITTPEFSDKLRLKEVLLKHSTILQANLYSSPLRYASSLSVKGFSSAASLANSWWGLDYYWKLKELVENIDQQIDSLGEKLSLMGQTLLRGSQPEILITCHTSQYEAIKKERFFGLGDLPVSPLNRWDNHIPLEATLSQGRMISAPVAFISKAVPTVSYIHPDSPALNLASFLFDNQTLHPKIREQGGAYGGGSSHHSTAGYFSFYSYRDPHIASSLDAFEEAVKEVKAGDFDEEEIEEAKLEMIQGLDAPVSPGSRGLVAFGWLKEGKNQALRQSFRDRLLQATKQDIQTAVEKYLLAPKESVTVITAGKPLLESENELLKERGKSPFPIKPIETP